MSGNGEVRLEDVAGTVRTFLARKERGGIDLKSYRAVIDALEGDFASEARHVEKTGEHLVKGSISAASWISRTCGMSLTSAADRLCVGEQLESLPKIAQALKSGDISHQSTSVLCHLHDQLGDKGDLFNEDEMPDLARRFSVFNLRKLCNYARHIADPDGFFNEAEENRFRRRLHISLMSDGMHAIDGILDPECGAAVKTALESLAKPRGPEDNRTHSQRMHDALAEAVQHAMDEGKLPRRNGVKPHLTVTTTLEGLKNEVGAPPADLELSLPISTRTLERIACDATISRVLLADSMVIDVGRATRVNSHPRGGRFESETRAAGSRAATGRSTGRLHTTSSPGREAARPTWPTKSSCYYHHRLVHEGGWQVIKAGREFRFLPPDRVVMRRARGPGMRWAA
jgi:hypothetical protein